MSEMLFFSVPPPCLAFCVGSNWEQNGGPGTSANDEGKHIYGNPRTAGPRLRNTDEHLGRPCFLEFAWAKGALQCGV